MIQSALLRLRRWLGSTLYRSNDPRKRRLGEITLAASQRLAQILGLVSSDLTMLGTLCGTDKSGGHAYTRIYEPLFRPLRWKRIKLLEIGVGGYHKETGGASLKLWKAFFRRAAIIGIDIHDKTGLSEGRVKVLQYSQADEVALDKLARDHGPFDLVIDDGSHVNAHQILTFRILFPHLRAGGIYIVEDVQTSYWPRYGGGSVGTDGYKDSCIRFFKEIVDSVNYPEMLEHNAETMLDVTIASVAFHQNLIILTKNEGRRGSTVNLQDPDTRAKLNMPPVRSS